MLNKVDKLVEATMLALQGKLELRENRLKSEARHLTAGQKKLIRQYVKDGKKKNWSELIRDLEKINDYETLNQDVRRFIDDIDLEESKKTKKSEGIDVNVDDKTTVSVEGNETIVDTEDATVIVNKKEDTFVPEVQSDISAEVAPDTDIIEVPADDTVMPEDIVNEPVDTELPTEDEELPLGESKKVENVKIEISDDGKEVEVKTDDGESVEVKDETEDKEDKEDKDTIEAPEEDKSEDETMFEENKKLEEEVPDIAYEIAEKVANEIREKGVMNFMDIVDRIVEISGMNIDDVYEQQLENDVYGCLGYEGIICNYSTGDFYTDEYAEQHPEIKEEGKHLTEGRVSEDCYGTMIKYFTDVVKETAQNLDSVNNTTKYMDVIKDEKVLNDVVEYVLDDDELWNIIVETIQYYLDAYADGKLPFKYEGKQAKQNDKDIKRDKKINRVQEMIARRRAKKQEEKEIPYDNTTEKICPRCNKKYTKFPALSRRDNKTYICPDCGTEEAMLDFFDNHKKEEMVRLKTKGLSNKKVMETKGLKEYTDGNLQPRCESRASFHKKSKARKAVSVKEAKKIEDKNDLGINEGVPKKEEPVPNTETKIQEKYNKQTFESVLTSYFKRKYRAVESVKVDKIFNNHKGMKIEAKLLDTNNKEKPVCLEMRKIQSGKSFDKYELIKSSGIVTESRAVIKTIMTTTNRNKYTECRYIINKKKGD